MNQTNQVNFKFEKGDRVFYAGNESLFISQDFGIVESIDEEGKVWVKWDSDGNNLWIESSFIALVERQNNSLDCSDNQDELSVKKCIDFLLSKGYYVTLSKK